MAESQIKSDEALIAAREDILFLHSPTHFLRELPVAPQQQRYGVGAALAFGSKNGEEVLPMAANVGQWLVQYLAWDSEYFGTSTYRVFSGLFGCTVSSDHLAAAAAALRQQLAERGAFYAFSVVPAEDIALLQAMTSSGWRLVETRLTFYCATATAILPAPELVRLAQPAEAKAIGQI